MEYTDRSVADVLAYPDPVYLIDNVIFKNSMILMGGYGGVGKSLVCLSIAKAIVTGEPLWGQYIVNEPGSVVLIDEETPEPLLKDRIIKMGFTKDMQIRFLHFKGITIDKDDSFQKLIRYVNRVKPKLIIVDSLIMVHRGEEQKSQDMAQVMGRFRDIVNQGTTLILIHHHRKMESEGMRKMARGSSAIVASVDVEYGLFEKDDYLDLHPLKQRLSTIEPIRLKLEFTDTEIRIDYLGRKHDILAKSIHNHLLAVGSKNLTQLYEVLTSRNITIGVNRLRTILKSNPKLFAQNTTPIGRTTQIMYSAL